MTLTTDQPIVQLVSEPLRAPDAEQAQQVFRRCLEAFSRPGLIRSLPAGYPWPAVAAPLLSLSDLMVAITGLADAAGLGREIAAATGAAVVETARARQAIAVSDTGALDQLNTGTNRSPERGALLVQRVADLTVPPTENHPCDDLLMELSGPGVNGRVRLAADGLAAEFVAQRNAACAEFPTGIDILLVTDDGRLAGLPRTTSVQVG